MFKVLRDSFRRFRKRFKQDPDRFLSDVNGVVHVGANAGQERETYHSHGLNVVWVEPIPEVFDQLKSNIQPFKDQVAFQELITNVDGKDYIFNIANNGGASSSVFDLKDHRDIWPEVEYTKQISLRSVTLTTLFNKEGLNPLKYQALVMDTQGSELLVLQGSIPLLGYFRYIKTEAPDFESYSGCSRLADIKLFMRENGFKEVCRTKLAKHKYGGRYYEVLFRNRRD
jgi:FkbM family methyltransferase